MELSINNKILEPKFRFENTKHKLGVKIWGDRQSFHELHGLLGECWDCEDGEILRAETCSYVGVVSYFSYEVRHAFMGDRLVMSYGKPVKELSDELLQLFEEEQEHFEVGVELTWPHMLFIMASWWECLKHQDCPVRVVGILREFTENIEQLLQSRSKVQYPHIEPFIHDAIYAANPYLMHTMEHVNANSLHWGKLFGKVSTKELADEMSCAAYGTYHYNDYIATLKRQAKKLGCPIEEMREQVDDSVYDTEL